VDTDNHFNGIGLHGVYDTRYERIIITKLDYIPVDSNVKYDHLTKEFYVEEPIVGSAPLRVVPNFYIGENNFFYSGLNGCCDDFDFVAGEIVPDPPTTTTTSTAGPTTTTSTTDTPRLGGCSLSGGSVTFTDCTLAGTGIITVGPTPPPCVRPANLIVDEFVIGYELLPASIGIDSTGSQSDACNAMTYLNTDPPNTIVNVIIGSYSFLSFGSIIYAGDDTETDCSVIPDGWYFTNESSFFGQVYNVVNGIVVEIGSCVNTTTTTTTDFPCTSYRAIKTTVGVTTVTYTDCTGALASVNVGLIGGGPSSASFCARCCVSTPPDVTLTNNGIC
jgi:hypothetical protein